MQVEITTLGAGTFDGDCKDKDEESLCERLNKSGPWVIFIHSQTKMPHLINIGNGTVIKRKR